MRTQLTWSLAIAFVFELSYFMLVPLISIHLTALGATPAELGVWLAWSAVIPALLVLYLGRMADRFGHLKTLMLGATIIAVSAGALSVANLPWVVTIFLGLLYLGDATVIIGNQVFVGSLGGPEQRVRNFGWVGAAMNVGAMLGAVLGGFLADWRGPWLSFAMVAAVAGGSLLFLPWYPNPKAAIASAAPAARRGILRQSWSMLGLGAIQYAVLAIVLTQLNSGARNSYYPVYLSEVGFSQTSIGFMFSTYALAGIVVRSVAGWLSDRLGTHRLMVISFLACAASLGLIPFTGSFLIQGLLAASLGAAHAVIHPLTTAALLEQVSADDRGLVFGLRMSIQRAVGIVIPLSLGWVAGGFGVGAPMVVAAVIMTLGIIPLHVLRPQAADGDASVSSIGQGKSNRQIR